MRRRFSQPGVNLFRCAVLALALVLATAAQAAIQDITSQFAISRSGFLLNRTTNTFDQTITLRNSSTAAVPAPIVVAISRLPPSVTLANKVGQTAHGKPYAIPAVPAGNLDSGATLSSALKFMN